MWQRLAVGLVIFFTLALFFVIMVSGAYLKRPFGSDDDVVGRMKEVSAAIDKSRWEEAEKAAHKLDVAWKKVSARIQISSEKDELLKFGESVQKLKASLKAHDRGNALLEIAVLRSTWGELR